MKKFRYCLSLMLVFAFVVGFTAPLSYAQETKGFTREEILAMDKSELLSTLMDNGLVLPDAYAKHIEDRTEGFVYYYVPLILNGEINPSIKIYNYDVSNVMLSSIGTVLYDMGLNPIRTHAVSSVNVTLKNSTPIGTWDSSYERYNCYAYALGKTNRFLIPGDLSGQSKKYDIDMPIEDMAKLVLDDLATEGYWGFTTATLPSSLPDKYFKIIALRKTTTTVQEKKDFHFMRPYSTSLSVWSHKPSSTQPLKWNYASPGEKYWTNERISNGVVKEADRTYNSKIIYILYKHKNDPGDQIWSYWPDYQ